jgi:hypothetical protein
MPRKPKPPPDDPEQSKRFIDMARDIGADASKEEFERVFKGSGANSRHEQTILASLCDVQARSTAFQTAGAARP